MNSTLNKEKSNEKQFEVGETGGSLLQDIKAHDAAAHNGQALKGTQELVHEFD